MRYDVLIAIRQQPSHATTNNQQPTLVALFSQLDGQAWLQYAKTVRFSRTVHDGTLSKTLVRDVIAEIELDVIEVPTMLYSLRSLVGTLP
jgi:hypothetical protein